MYRLIGALLLLAGCGGAAITSAPVYRDHSAPFSSIALFDPARFAGTWHEIAGFPAASDLDCATAHATYTQAADGTLSVVKTCNARALDGLPRQIKGRATPIGPGRLNVKFDTGDALSGPYWVLWVDQSYRTAVIGLPSGKAAWILNRAPTIPADRLTAAREILDFNGFDLRQLRLMDQMREPG